MYVFFTNLSEAFLQYFTVTRCYLSWFTLFILWSHRFLQILNTPTDMCVWVLHNELLAAPRHGVTGRQTHGRSKWDHIFVYSIYEYKLKRLFQAINCDAAIHSLYLNHQNDIDCFACSLTSNSTVFSVSLFFMRSSSFPCIMFRDLLRFYTTVYRVSQHFHLLSW